MTTIYQETPRASEGSGVGLVAGLVLVLAVIALVFLATRVVPGAGNVIDTTPSNGAGVQVEGSGSVQGGGSTGGDSGATAQ
jgi:hypothetical protein